MTAYPPNFIARSHAIDLNYVQKQGTSEFFPQSVYILGPSNDTAAIKSGKHQVQSAQDVAAICGYGSRPHLAAKVLFPEIASIPVWLLPLDSSALDGADIQVTPVGTVTKSGTFYLVYNETYRSAPFTVEVGDSIDDIVVKMDVANEAAPDVPCVADGNGIGNSNFSDKTGGAIGIDLSLEVVGPTDTGISFGINKSENGSGTPDITAALAEIGQDWATLMINCLEYDNATVLNELSEFGESVRTPLKQRPIEIVVGTREADRSVYEAVFDPRIGDRTNVLMPHQGSPSLTCVIAAAAVQQMALTRSRQPAKDYVSVLKGVLPGPDNIDREPVARNDSMLKGCSATEIRGNQVIMSDTITPWRPVGEEEPGFRYSVDQAKLGAYIYGVRQILISPTFDGAPWVTDEDVTDDKEVRKAKDLKTAFIALIQRLGKKGILSNVEAIIASLNVDVSGTFSKRIESQVDLGLAGNGNQFSNEANFSFVYGAIN